MLSTQQKLAALETVVLEQDELIQTLLKVAAINQETVESMCNLLRKYLPQTDELWQDYQERQVRRKISGLN